jgi:phage/plasmid-associated DNA primase
MYRDRFKCVNARAGQWMEFVGHRWRTTDDAIALRRLMIEEVDRKYVDFKIDVVTAQRNASDEDRGRLELKQKKIEAIISALRTTAFQDRVLKICRIYMYDDRFFLKADEDTSVFCCENGVFDLELGVFREGRPEDYCTLSSPVEYHEFNIDDDEVRNMLEVLKKMFWSEPELLDYLFLMVSMGASGRNVLKRFVCCTGDTNGGKSVFFRLCELAFGEGDSGYMFKIPRERRARPRPISPVQRASG